MKKVAVLTSGGDSPGMNALIRSIVRASRMKDYEIYGVDYGFAGLVSNNFNKLRTENINSIVAKGGTILYSSRYPDFFKIETQKRAVENLKSANIDILIVIGGDGSVRGAQALANLGVSTLCIPATIDNDIFDSEYTIGFDTAVNTYLSAIDKIRDTATSHVKTFIIEVMGNKSGSIALWSGISSGAEFIVIPEIDHDTHYIAKKINHHFKNGKKHCLLILAEGAVDTEHFAKELEQLGGFDTRQIKLGHMARGGSPTAYDRVLASKMGLMAIDLIESQVCNKLLAIQKGKLVHLDISDCLAKKQHDEIKDNYLLNNQLSS